MERRQRRPLLPSGDVLRCGARPGDHWPQSEPWRRRDCVSTGGDARLGHGCCGSECTPWRLSWPQSHPPGAPAGSGEGAAVADMARATDSQVAVPPVRSVRAPFLGAWVSCVSASWAACKGLGGGDGPWNGGCAARVGADSGGREEGTTAAAAGSALATVTSGADGGVGAPVAPDAADGRRPQLPPLPLPPGC